MELRMDYSDSNKRHLCLVKANYIPNDEKLMSYVLKFDDNLVFTKLDQRVAFASLAKPELRRMILKKRKPN